MANDITMTILTVVAIGILTVGIMMLMQQQQQAATVVVREDPYLRYRGWGWPYRRPWGARYVDGHRVWY